MEEAENPITIHTKLFDFLGFNNAINPYTVSLLAMGIVLVLLWIAARKPRLVPSGVQNFIEMVIEFVQGLAEPLAGKHAEFFFPLFFMLFLYIFIANLMGLIPGSISPTSRLEVNASMALMIFVLTHVWGIKEKGLKYFNHFLPPKIPMDSPNFFLRLLMRFIYLALLILMPIIHVIGELVKPVSLTFRLFGNMMAKEKLLAILVFLVTVFWDQGATMKLVSAFPFLLKSLIVVLGVFVSFVQAFVFMLLAMVYIGGAVESHDHEPEEGHAESAA